ncbi:hypothetical protein [Ligilactobacillus agilis]|jgi:hypothetical protein|uniref:Uncharacterized protein n=2 Tax=Ligilactobacillus agilis TaxID=1601 RepID=A0A0R2ABY1_9LACO|nr:hypothetical protein [Ligilactobacillus agilis]ASR41006.1 hypothetical protein BEN83_05685 [Ligilactobacillus agilis]KRM64958.1 hypothetical protein FC14_GL001609 [Ligilactobacillus agilis DSM 20509]MBL1056338.1 hypothetical protein [Ligilactobacillus agilis]MBM6763407.1 hypothetical protein [Ligilactobacillus agilis]MBM6773107.1 hypothetical protein [Ligilactobacillus agilis]
MTEEQVETKAENLSRTEMRKQQKELLEEAKITKLKRRLNYVIAFLVTVLILILLFMRFINF